MVFLGPCPRLVWDAPLALEFDGPQAQRHSSPGALPQAGNRDAPLALEFEGPQAQRHSSLGHRPR